MVYTFRTTKHFDFITNPKHLPPHSLSKRIKKLTSNTTFNASVTGISNLNYIVYFILQNICIYLYMMINLY